MIHRTFHSDRQSLSEEPSAPHNTACKMATEINSPAVQQQPRQQLQLSTPTKIDCQPTPTATNATPKKISFVTPDKNSSHSNSAASQQQQFSRQTKPRPSPTTVQRTQQLQAPAKKHEEFKNQLVHDVFGRDNKGRVPMEKVVMLIWQFRDDPAVVQFMAQFVGKVCLPGLLG